MKRYTKMKYFKVWNKNTNSYLSGRSRKTTWRSEKSAKDAMKYCGHHMPDLVIEPYELQPVVPPNKEDIQSYECIELFPGGPEVGDHALMIQSEQANNPIFIIQENPHIELNHNPADFPKFWKAVDTCNYIGNVEFNLRDNADIISLAIEAAQSLDPTDLKKYFKNKLNL